MNKIEIGNKYSKNYSTEAKAIAALTKLVGDEAGYKYAPRYVTSQIDGRWYIAILLSQSDLHNALRFAHNGFCVIG